MLLSAALLFAQPAELGRNQSDELEAVLTEKSLQIHGVASAQVAYLGASLHEERQGWARVETYSGILADDDADGQLEFTPAAGISVASVWIVVDLASGTVSEVTPTGFVKQLPKEAAGIEWVAFVSRPRQAMPARAAGWWRARTP